MAPEHIDNLYTLNQLLALATGSNPEWVTHIKHAIDFSLADGNHEPIEFNSFSCSAEQLLNVHTQERKKWCFAHCDLFGYSDDPLFIRAKLIESLRVVAGSRRALLLISGLKQVTCDNGNRWSRTGKRRYREWITYIESVAVQSIDSKTNLRLIFL